MADDGKGKGEKYLRYLWKANEIEDELGKKREVKRKQVTLLTSSHNTQFTSGDPGSRTQDPGRNEEMTRMN